MKHKTAPQRLKDAKYISDQILCHLVISLELNTFFLSYVITHYHCYLISIIKYYAPYFIFNHQAHNTCIDHFTNELIKIIKTLI